MIMLTSRERTILSKRCTCRSCVIVNTSASVNIACKHKGAAQRRTSAVHGSRTARVAHIGSECCIRTREADEWSQCKQRSMFAIKLLSTNGDGATLTTSEREWNRIEHRCNRIEQSGPESLF
jgi:hypothetical protein